MIYKEEGDFRYLFQGSIYIILMDAVGVTYIVNNRAAKKWKIFHDFFFFRLSNQL